MLTYANGIAVFDNKPGTFEAELKLAAIERMPKRNALKLMKLMRECASADEWAALYEDAIAVAGERTREAYEKASGKRKEPAMKRAKFYIMGVDKPTPMDGYEFEANTGDKFYVHRKPRGQGMDYHRPCNGHAPGHIWRNPHRSHGACHEADEPRGANRVRSRERPARQGQVRRA